MRITEFNNLTDSERRQFFEAARTQELPPGFADTIELEQYLRGPVYDDGSTYLTLWDEDVLVGSVGVVVREIAVRGEAFLTFLYLFTSDAETVLEVLLKVAYALVGGHAQEAGNEVEVKIGLTANAAHLSELLERAGCRWAYQIVNMARPLDSAQPAGATPVGSPAEGSPAAPAAVRFEPLTKENLMDYLTVHNEAFLDTPNGAQLVPEEVDQMRRDARSGQFLQVGYIGVEPVTVFEVDVRGELGQIQAVGVTPEFQGRGIGRTALARALQVLAEAGAREARLQVVERNERAVTLYQACGFAVDRVVSTWYDGPGLETIMQVE